MEPAGLQMTGLSFSYPGHPVLKNLSGVLKPGVNLLCGAEGRGKTTLLRVLAGELRASGGTLHLGGVDLAARPEFWKQEVFWADPRSEAHHQRSAAQWFSALPQTFPRLDADLLRHLTEGLGLDEHLAKPLYMLSTGSRRKVWLAGALASGATLTLVDEPFAALDKRSVTFLADLLTEAARHPSRLWLLADYEAPEGLPLAGVIDLGQ